MFLLVLKLWIEECKNACAYLRNQSQIIFKSQCLGNIKEERTDEVV